MLAELKDGGRWHGVYLALHGAMGVRGVKRPEADIARRVRELVGRDAFIAGTFDPHGNEDAEFLRQADFAFCAKYFPHYDSRLQGERAARMLIRAIRRDYTPATATVKVPILTATVLQWTGASPWMDLVQRALVWEAREPDDIHDNLRRLYDAFGPARWFWGTDITRMPCPWRQCVTLFTEELPWLKGHDLELVMGRAVCDWLGWKR